MPTACARGLRTGTQKARPQTRQQPAPLKQAAGMNSISGRSSAGVQLRPRTRARISYSAVFRTGHVYPPMRPFSAAIRCDTVRFFNACCQGATVTAVLQLLARAIAIVHCLRALRRPCPPSPHAMVNPREWACGSRLMLLLANISEYIQIYAPTFLFTTCGYFTRGIYGTTVFQLPVRHSRLRCAPEKTSQATAERPVVASSSANVEASVLRVVPQGSRR